MIDSNDKGVFEDSVLTNREKIESFDEGRVKESDPEEEKEEVEEEETTSGFSRIEERFEEIRNRISEKIKGAKEGVAYVSELRKDAIRRRRKAAETLFQASEKFRDLEKELEDACEAEDFEKADVVSQRLSRAEEEKEGLVVSLRNAEVDCDALDSEMVRVLQSQIEVEDECASLLNNFSMVIV